MRLSSIQNDVLFILYAIEKKGNKEPMPGMVIFNMINNSRPSEIFDTNFRSSCHTLNENMMIDKYRTPSLTLAWALTELGRQKAGEIFKDKTK